MGMKRLGNRGRAKARWQTHGEARRIWVRGIDDGSVIPRTPPHAASSGSGIERSVSQRDGHLGAVTALDRTRRTGGQDQESTKVLF